MASVPWLVCIFTCKTSTCWTQRYAAYFAGLRGLIPLARGPSRLSLIHAVLVLKLSSRHLVVKTRALCLSQTASVTLLGPTSSRGSSRRRRQ